MTSVLRNRCLLQLSFSVAFALMVAVLWGCTPAPEKKVLPSTTTAKPLKAVEPAEEVTPPAVKEEAAPEEAPAKEEPAMEQPKEEPAKEEPKPEPPKEEPKAEPVKEQPKEQPKEEPAKEEPKPEPPKEEPKPEPAKEPPKEEPAKEELKPDPPKEEPKPDPPANEAPAAANDNNNAAAKDVAKEKFDPTEVVTVAWLPSPVNGVGDAKEEKEMKPYGEEISGTGVKFEMLPIPGGKFMMGSPDGEAERADDEGPQHEVTVEPFWMGKCEVTWEEYEQWGMGLDQQRRTMTKQEATSRDLLADAVAKPTKPYTDMTFGMGKDGYPAICMTQLAARCYCKWLSAKTGHYYRLPTEAEWEYACRAGGKTAFSFGDGPEQIGDYAWFIDNCDDKYHKVGQKKPNPWGLHDMHGNVAEWVLDQYIPDFYKQYAGKTTDRPLAVPKTIHPLAARGGCWDDDPAQCRSASRRGSSKDWKMQDPQIPQSIWYVTEINCPGFRVVRPLRIPSPEEAKLYEPDVQEIKEYRAAQAGKQ